MPPTIVMAARGNHIDGYHGVVERYVDPDDVGRLGRPAPFDLFVCPHRHRLTRTARDCARRAALRMLRGLG